MVIKAKPTAKFLIRCSKFNCSGKHGFKISFYILALSIFLSLFSPVPFFIYNQSLQSVWHKSQQMVKSMSSTVDPEARQHQATLQSTTQAFVKLMRPEDHHHSKYVNYIKNMKFLVDSHIPQLSGHEQKDVAKMIMTTI